MADEAPNTSRGGARYRRAARKYRGKLLQTRKELADRDQLLEELLDEHDQLQGQHETATKELGELKGKSKADALRKAFDVQAAKANVDGEYADDLYKLIDLADAVDGDEIDAKAIGKAIVAAVKRRPYMIKKANDEEEGEGEGDETETEEENDDDDEPTPEPKGKTKLKPESKAKPMEKGEGHGRGGRTNLKPATDDQQIDEDYAATGRDADQPFRI